jgi:hypothetical protein
LVKSWGRRKRESNIQAACSPVISARSTVNRTAHAGHPRISISFLHRSNRYIVIHGPQRKDGRHGRHLVALAAWGGHPTAGAQHAPASRASQPQPQIKTMRDLPKGYAKTQTAERQSTVGGSARQRGRQQGVDAALQVLWAKGAQRGGRRPGMAAPRARTRAGGKVLAVAAVPSQKKQL